MQICLDGRCIDHDKAIKQTPELLRGDFRKFAGIMRPLEAADFPAFILSAFAESFVKNMESSLYIALQGLQNNSRDLFNFFTLVLVNISAGSLSSV